jgi:enoyl-CoA hydratase/carnithine racemase
LPIRRSTGSTCGFRNVFGGLSMTRVKAMSALCWSKQKDHTSASAARCGNGPVIINWFRTFVAEVNLSYRAIEALRVPTIAAVQGVAFGGGFELALNCDLIVAAENAVFRCVEVTTGMLPIAGALQRLAERVGRGRASRFAMLGEPISGALAGQLGIASQVVPEAEVSQTAEALAKKLALGPTKSYAATRTLLKAWSAGGVPAADAVMLDIAMDLFNTEDCTRGFLNTAKAFDRDIEPPDMVFSGH